MRMAAAGEQLGMVPIENDPIGLALEVAEGGQPGGGAGGHLRVVLGGEDVLRRSTGCIWRTG